jgi:sugar-specific transcriptional regulator TrmB
VTDHKLLVDLGLTTYEAKTYRALVRRASSTGAQVATMAGLPRQRVYDVLDALVAKGLVVEQPGPSARFTAVEPTAAIDRLLAIKRDELAALEEGGATLVAELSEEFSEGRQYADPLDYVEVLRDPRHVAARWDELQQQVTKEVLVCSKPPYVTPLESNRVGLEVAKHHRYLSLYETAGLEDEAFVAGVEDFHRVGELARFLDELPLKFAVLDEKIVLFALPDPTAGPAALTTVVVEHAALAVVLKLAFETLWEQAQPYEEAVKLATARPLDAV